MGLKGFEVRAQRSMWRNTIELYFRKDYPDGKFMFVTMNDLTLYDGEQTFDFKGEPITIDDTTAQRLMDELWNCGFRPSEGTGSAGSLKKTENHLEDTRIIRDRLFAMVETIWNKETQ